MFFQFGAALQDNGVDGSTFIELGSNRDKSSVQYRDAIYIGEGAFGKVYKAFDSKHQSFVALKSVPLLDSSGGKLHENAVAELTILKYIGDGHSNVIKLLNICVGETGSEPPSLMMVMELCQSDLRAYLDHNEMSAPQIKKMMHGIVLGMNFVHEKRIIHADLKTDNILLADGLIPKIADFGISQIDHPDDPEDVMQTLYYRAPEVLLMKPLYGVPIDVWSIGCIFAELYTSQIFFFPGETVTKYDEADQFQLSVRLCREEILTENMDKTDWTVHDGMHTWKIANWISDKWLDTRISRFGQLPVGLVNNRWTQSDGSQWFTGKLVLMKNDHLSAYSLFQEMMQFYPNNRLTLQQALDHPYFNSSN